MTPRRPAQPRAVTRQRLEDALAVMAVVVTLDGAPARGLFRRLETELAHLDEAEAEGRALEARAAALAARAGMKRRA